MIEFFRANPYAKLGFDAPDELGTWMTLTERPAQAPLASAAHSTAGAALLLVVSPAAPASSLT